MRIEYFVQSEYNDCEIQKIMRHEFSMSSTCIKRVKLYGIVELNGVHARVKEHVKTGDIAEKIVADLERLGGVLTLEDFKNHTSDWVDPISVDYRGYRAYNLPPNTQGMASLSILNILNNFDFSNIEEGSADYYHLLVEAIKLAFIDRDQYLTDPKFSDIPLEELLSPAHGEKLANVLKESLRAKELQPLDAKGDTVWFGVVDGEGNAVSFIQSIYHEFGSGIIPRGTGVILQNRGSFFSLIP